MAIQYQSLPVGDALLGRLVTNRQDRARFRKKEQRFTEPDGPKGFTAEEIWRLWECDREGLELAEQIVAELKAAVEHNRAVQESYG